MENTNYELIIALVLGAIWAGIILFISPSGGIGPFIGNLAEPSVAANISSYEALQVSGANMMLFFDDTATAIFYPEDFKLKPALPSLEISGASGRIIIGTKQTHIEDVEVNGANIVLDGNANLRKAEIDGANVSVKGSFGIELLRINGLNITFKARLSNIGHLEANGANVSGDLHLSISKSCNVDISSGGGHLNIYIPKGRRRLLKLRSTLTSVSIIEEK